MSIFDSPEQLRQLQSLLNPNQRRPGVDYGSSSEDEDESMVVPKMTPGGIGPSQTPGTSGKPRSKKKLNPLATPLVEEEKKQPATLEEWEVQQQEDNDILDTRKTPEHTLTYRQAVGTEDVFLQMGNRTGSSASCEDLIVEISMPDEAMAADKMSLSLQETELDLATCLYRLRLPLPHPVDVDRCQARYDSEQRKLRLTLRLKRELDFVNF